MRRASFRPASQLWSHPSLFGL